MRVKYLLFVIAFGTRIDILVFEMKALLRQPADHLFSTFFVFYYRYRSFNCSPFCTWSWLSIHIQCCSASLHHSAAVFGDRIEAFAKTADAISIGVPELAIYNILTRVLWRTDQRVLCLVGDVGILSWHCCLGYCITFLMSILMRVFCSSLSLWKLSNVCYTFAKKTSWYLRLIESQWVITIFECWPIVLPSRFHIFLK